MRGHRKTDRLLDVIERLALPTVFFAAGGGGSPGRHRHPAGLGARRDDVRGLGPALRPGAADRGRRRQLLRRQRRHRGLRRPDRRDPALVPRHGRPGDDRRRRAGRRRGRRRRPARRDGRQRRRRRGRRRRRRRRRGPRPARLLPRAARRLDRRRPDAAARRGARGRADVVRRRGGRRDPRRRRLRDRAAPRRSRPSWSRRWGASRAAPSASSPTTPGTWPARSPPTPATRRRASCSCATRSASRSSRWSTPPA